MKLLITYGFEMKYPIIVLVFLISLTVYGQTTGNKQEGTVNPNVIPAKIQLKPDNIVVKDYRGKFYTKEINVLNRGGNSLQISKVTASCKCGMGTIIESQIEPLTIGKILLNINLTAINDEHYEVEFTVFSNASNSPTSIKVIFENYKP